MMTKKSNKGRPMDTDGMRALCAAVVANACEEFLQAPNKQAWRYLDWFRSQDFEFYSDLDPETVIRQLIRMKNKGRKTLYPLNDFA